VKEILYEDETTKVRKGESFGKLFEGVHWEKRKGVRNM